MTAALAPGRTGAMLARGKSKQNYRTPRVFLAAVEARFGDIRWDLAATERSAVAGGYFGPDHPDPACRNALSPDCVWPSTGTLWLNPEFDNIAPWAARCAAWKPLPGAKIVLLTPASVGSNWFAEHVHRKAMVLPLRPRIAFVGERYGYPKDLMISVFDGYSVGFEPWRWSEQPARRGRLRRVA